MPPQRQRTPGRPRGSGRVATVNGIQLTDREAVPFHAGFGAYLENPDAFTSPPITLATFSPYLSTAERRILAGEDGAFFLNWLTVGMIAASFETALAYARGA